MTEVTICEECYGNGFVRVPTMKRGMLSATSIYTDQYEIEQCDVCHSSGEVQSSPEETEERR